MLKHSPSSSAVSSLSTQHKLQLPFQTTSSIRGLNPCRRHFLWMMSFPRHTWECPVSSVDPPVQQRAAQLQSLLGDCSSGPALSDGRGWSSELRPEKHSLPVWPGSQTSYTHTHKLLYLFWLRAVHTKVTTFIKRIHSIWRTSREEDKENRKRKWGDDIITDIRTSLTWMWNRILNKCSFLNSYNSMRYCSVRVRSVPDVFGTLRPFLHRF